MVPLYLHVVYGAMGTVVCMRLLKVTLSEIEIAHVLILSNTSWLNKCGNYVVNEKRMGVV